MNSIKVSKEKLLDTIKKNRNTHRTIFLEAQNGYRKECIAHLEKTLEMARSGKQFNIYLHIDRPVDQTKDYDRVIKMLEMSKDKTITLSEIDFQQYVMDDWKWKHSFLRANAKYSETATVACQTLGLDSEQENY